MHGSYSSEAEDILVWLPFYFPDWFPFCELPAMRPTRALPILVVQSCSVVCS